MVIRKYTNPDDLNNNLNNNTSNMACVLKGKLFNRTLDTDLHLGHTFDLDNNHNYDIGDQEVEVLLIKKVN